MKNKISTLVFTLFIFFNSHDAAADRKILMPPDLIQYTAESYFSSEYLDKLNKAEKVIATYNNQALKNIFLKLYRTSRKKTAQKIIVEINEKMCPFREADVERFDKLQKILKEIQEDIDESKFSNYRTGADCEIDEINREYIVKWDDNGKEIVLKKPFVPEMKITVKAEFIPKIKNGQKMFYRYWLTNDKNSKGSFMEMYLENKFTQNFIFNLIKPKFGSMTVNSQISPSILLSVSYPEGNINYFHFFTADSKTEMLIKSNPGENTTYPYELEELESSLPGLVKCYVPVVGFDMFATDLEVPEIVSDVFSTPPDKRTRYMYSGRTVGPVPLIGPFNKAKFIDQIISYNSQSIAEGWINEPDIAVYTKKELAKIRQKPDNKKNIRDFIARIEGLYHQDKMLSEAFVLLKYNLEYLLSKM